MQESSNKSARDPGTPRWGNGPLEIAFFFVMFPVVHLLARLPMGALHFFADVTAFAAYRVLRVRRRIVLESLRRAFPEKSAREIDRIAMDAYRNQCDVAAEGLKMLVATPAVTAARVDTDIDLAADLCDAGRSVIYVMGHNANWEWAIPATAAVVPKLTLHVVYHPLSDPGFDRVLKSMRARFGAVLTPMDQAPRAIVRMRGMVSAVILVADQRPRRRQHPHHTMFLNCDTAFLTGPERLARRLGLPVVFVDMRRVARGRDHLAAEWLCEDPQATSEGEITERFARRLERQIWHAPDDWLWLHRRWHDRRAERAERLEMENG